MKKFLLIVWSVVFINHIANAQQDAQFSQYMFNGIYINPAYAGYQENLNFNGFYRNQWVGLKGAPKTLSMAVDATANDKKIGLAFQINSDQLGAEKHLSMYGDYAYRLRVGENARLAMGLGAGIIQMSLDGTVLDPIEQGDQIIPVDNQSVIVPDFRTGLFYSNDRMYAGFSADKIFPQYYNYDQLPYVPRLKTHYYLTAGHLFPLSKNYLLKPSFLLKDDTGGPTSLDLNTFLLINERVWIGTSYRTGVKLYNKKHLQNDLSNVNSISFLTEIYATDQWRIGYAYDYSLHKAISNNSSHEISIGYSILPKKVKMRTPRYF